MKCIFLHDRAGARAGGVVASVEATVGVAEVEETLVGRRGLLSTHGRGVLHVGHFNDVLGGGSW